MADDQVLDTSGVAKLFNTTDESVRRWAKGGKLPYFTTPSGRMRFHRADVEAFLTTPAADAAAS
jgi:excisionase family DNA binding protein